MYASRQMPSSTSRALPAAASGTLPAGWCSHRTPAAAHHCLVWKLRPGSIGWPAGRCWWVQPSRRLGAECSSPHTGKCPLKCGMPPARYLHVQLQWSATFCPTCASPRQGWAVLKERLKERLQGRLQAWQFVESLI